jgi:hypothetical protein
MEVVTRFCEARRQYAGWCSLFVAAGFCGGGNNLKKINRSSAETAQLYSEEARRGRARHIRSWLHRDPAAVSIRRSWHFKTAFAVAFNARGYPPSDVPRISESYSQDIAADDIAAVLNGLGIERRISSASRWRRIVLQSALKGPSAHFRRRSPGSAQVGRARDLSSHDPGGGSIDRNARQSAARRHTWASRTASA